MKKLILSLGAIFIASVSYYSAAAQQSTSSFERAPVVDISASKVNGQCLRVFHRNYDPAGMCTLLITGFMNGYFAGIKTGVRAGFMKDSENLRSIQGIDDATKRILEVQSKAVCIPDGATVPYITGIFVAFMNKHPEMGREPYYVPLERALEEAFPCSK